MLKTYLALDVKIKVYHLQVVSLFRLRVNLIVSSSTISYQLTHTYATFHPVVSPMPPKADASKRAEELKTSGLNKQEAAAIFLREFPSLSKSRRSQLLTACYKNKQSETQEANESDADAKLIETPMKSRHYLESLKSKGMDLSEAKRMIQEQFPTMSPSNRAHLFARYWKSSSCSSNEVPPAKRRRLWVKQRDPVSDRSHRSEGEQKYIEEAVQIRSMLEFIDVPRDGHCFYHCMDHYQKQGIRSWRMAVAAELRMHYNYYSSFLPDGELDTHIIGVTQQAWGDHHDVAAAATILGRVIVVFRKDSDQLPTVCQPTRDNPTSEIIYLLLDETSPGQEHYSLLLMPHDTPTKGNQSDLTPEQRIALRTYLSETDAVTWYQLRDKVMSDYGLELSYGTSRRLYDSLTTKEGETIGQVALHLYYNDIAFDLMIEHPNWSWASLRSALQQTYNLSISDGVMQRFYESLNLMNYPLLSIHDLRLHYTSCLEVAFKSNKKLTWIGAKRYIESEHKVTANDITMRRFWKEIAAAANQVRMLNVEELLQEFKDVGLNLLHETKCLQDFSSELSKLKVTAQDFDMRRFYTKLQEISDGTNYASFNELMKMLPSCCKAMALHAKPSIDDLHLYLKQKCDVQVRKTVLAHFWAKVMFINKPMEQADMSTKSAVATTLRSRGLQPDQYMINLIFYAGLWQKETCKFVTFKNTWSKGYSISMSDLVQTCLNNDTFNCWASVLSWCFCDKCGRRWLSPDTYLDTPQTKHWTCRSCDLHPDVMEQDHVCLFV